MVNFLKYVGVITFICGIIVGVVNGQEISETARFLGVDDKGFSISTALVWWVSGLISGSVLFALGMILEKVSDNSYYLYELMRRIPQPKEEPKPSLGNSRFDINKLKDYKMKTSD